MSGDDQAHAGVCQGDGPQGDQGGPGFHPSGRQMARELGRAAVQGRRSTAEYPKIIRATQTPLRVGQLREEGTLLPRCTIWDTRTEPVCKLDYKPSRRCAGGSEGGVERDVVLKPQVPAGMRVIDVTLSLGQKRIYAASSSSSLRERLRALK
jgi:hypothetical protein